MACFEVQQVRTARTQINLTLQWISNEKRRKIVKCGWSLLAEAKPCHIC